MILKIHKEGLVLNVDAPLSWAKKKMAKYKDAKCLVSCWNGQELFIKENGKVRVSTEKEYVCLSTFEATR